MNFNRADWEEFIGEHALSPDEVHVWRIGLEMAPADLAELRQLLSRDEQERADRFHFEADRRRNLISRGYLRLLLGKILKLPADTLRFEYNEFGKPRLTPILGPPLQFNVSHSGELILIAVAIGRAVGIDVERIQMGFDVDELAKLFFSARDREALASLNGRSKSEAFFRCWTLNEAYLKARGVGLSAPLDQLEMCFLSDQEPRPSAAWPDPEPGEASRWTLRLISPSADYAAAVAAQGSNWKVKCWTTSSQSFQQLIT